MLIAGDSPVIDNPHGGYRGGPNGPLFNLPSLPASLDQAKLTWRTTMATPSSTSKALLEGRNSRSNSSPLMPPREKLPNVSWVYADHAESEHPLGNVTTACSGPSTRSTPSRRAGSGPARQFSSLGTTGRLAGPCGPAERQSWPADGTQFRYGSRVGCLVLSPFAKSGFISKMLHSH